MTQLGDETETMYVYHSNMSTPILNYTYERRIRDHAPHGLKRYYCPMDSMLLQGVVPFVDGKAHGLYHHYCGSITTLVHYVEGQRHGVELRYQGYLVVGCDFYDHGMTVTKEVLKYIVPTQRNRFTMTREDWLLLKLKGWDFTPISPNQVYQPYDQSYIVG